ncbi:hypothetical protein [Phytoactinopolyspora limicola]|uniref:hypothetical protein n=1 Tax=Phytoactinopolyspora limicola TaxID=2715536 RepID=UPI001407D1B4|nr:hypothetical protein [Phytoactinopolyspora limicola]
MRLSDVGDSIRRRWRVVTAAVVLAVLAAGGLGMMWPERYTATAVVSVSPITPDPFGTGTSSAGINMTTEQQVVRSTEIARAAAERMELVRFDPRTLVGNVSVTSPSDSQILQIAYTASTPTQAARGANAFAEAYLESRVTSADQLAERIIDALETRINELVEQVEDADDALVDAAAQQQIVELRQQQSSLVTVTLNPGRIIEAARAPGSPSSPGLPVAIAGGLVGGLLVGIALALLRDRNDRRVTHAARLRELLGGCPVIDGTAEPDPDEPYRHALLELTRAHPLTSSDGPVLTAIVGPADGRIYEAATSLVDVAHSHRMRARLIDSDRMDMSAVDGGWPARSDVATDWPDDDLVVLDLTMITSRTRRVAIALRCDTIIVATTKRSRHRPIQEFVEQLTATDRGIDLGLLLPERSGSRKPTPTEFTADNDDDRRHTRRSKGRDSAATGADEPTGWPLSTGQLGSDR